MYPTMKEQVVQHCMQVNAMFPPPMHAMPMVSANTMLQHRVVSTYPHVARIAGTQPMFQNADFPPLATGTPPPVASPKISVLSPQGLPMSLGPTTAPMSAPTSEPPSPAIFNVAGQALRYRHASEQTSPSESNASMPSYPAPYRHSSGPVPACDTQSQLYQNTASKEPVNVISGLPSTVDTHYSDKVEPTISEEETTIDVIENLFHRKAISNGIHLEKPHFRKSKTIAGSIQDKALQKCDLFLKKALGHGIHIKTSDGVHVPPVQNSNEGSVHSDEVAAWSLNCNNDINESSFTSDFTGQSTDSSRASPETVENDQYLQDVIQRTVMKALEKYLPNLPTAYEPENSAEKTTVSSLNPATSEFQPRVKAAAILNPFSAEFKCKRNDQTYSSTSQKPADPGVSALRAIAAPPDSSDKSSMTEPPATSNRATWTGGWYGDADGMRRLEARAMAAEVEVTQLRAWVSISELRRQLSEHESCRQHLEAMFKVQNSAVWLHSHQRKCTELTDRITQVQADMAEKIKSIRSGHLLSSLPTSPTCIYQGHCPVLGTPNLDVNASSPGKNALPFERDTPLSTLDSHTESTTCVGKTMVYLSNPAKDGVESSLVEPDTRYQTSANTQISKPDLNADKPKEHTDTTEPVTSDAKCVHKEEISLEHKAKENQLATCKGETERTIALNIDSEFLHKVESCPTWKQTNASDYGNTPETDTKQVVDLVLPVAPSTCDFGHVITLDNNRSSDDTSMTCSVESSESREFLLCTAEQPVSETSCEPCSVDSQGFVTCSEAAIVDRPQESLSSNDENFVSDEPLSIDQSEADECGSLDEFSNPDPSDDWENASSNRPIDAEPTDRGSANYKPSHPEKEAVCPDSMSMKKIGATKPGDKKRNPPPGLDGMQLVDEDEDPLSAAPGDPAGGPSAAARPPLPPTGSADVPSSLDMDLYQAVVAKLRNLYPEMAAHSEMLHSVALQQTCLLQHYRTSAGTNTSATTAEKGKEVDDCEGKISEATSWQENNYCKGSSEKVLADGDVKHDDAEQGRTEATSGTHAEMPEKRQQSAKPSSEKQPEDHSKVPGSSDSLSHESLQPWCGKKSDTLEQSPMEPAKSTKPHHPLLPTPAAAKFLQGHRDASQAMPPYPMPGQRAMPMMQTMPGHRFAPPPLMQGQKSLPLLPLPGQRFSPPMLAQRAMPSQSLPGQRINPQQSVHGQRVMPPQAMHAQLMPGQRVNPQQSMPGQRALPSQALPGQRVMPPQFMPGQRMVPSQAMPGQRVSPPTSQQVPESVSPAMASEENWNDEIDDYTTGFRLKPQQEPQTLRGPEIVRESAPGGKGYRPTRAEPRPTSDYYDNVQYTADKEGFKADLKNKEAWPAVRSEPPEVKSRGSAEKDETQDTGVLEPTVHTKNAHADEINPFIRKNSEESAGSRSRAGSLCLIDETDNESPPPGGAEGEEWTQVCKKKKRDALTSELPQSNKPKKSSYDKLLEKLQETFMGLSKAEAADLVKDIRRQRGNLSGVTVKQILDAAFNLIKKRIQDGQLKLPCFNEDHVEPCGEKQCLFFLRFLKYKTDMCTPQGSGACKQGDKCWYAHTRAELRPLPKREMCPYQLKGSCKHAEKCVFAHNVGELNVPEYESSFSKSTAKVPTNLPPRLQKIQRSKSHDTDPDEGEICVICCDNLSDYVTKALDCGHIFHEECIKKWVYGQERTCPTCRQLALFPEEFPRLGKE